MQDAAISIGKIGGGWSKYIIERNSIPSFGQIHIQIVPYMRSSNVFFFVSIFYFIIFIFYLLITAIHRFLFLFSKTLALNHRDFHAHTPKNTPSEYTAHNHHHHPHFTHPPTFHPPPPTASFARAKASDKRDAHRPPPPHHNHHHRPSAAATTIQPVRRRRCDPRHEFTCRSSSEETECIPQRRYCDTIRDCADGSDEANCSASDHEAGYLNDVANDYLGNLRHNKPSVDDDRTNNNAPATVVSAASPVGFAVRHLIGLFRLFAPLTRTHTQKHTFTAHGTCTWMSFFCGVFEPL